MDLRGNYSLTGRGQVFDALLICVTVLLVYGNTLGMGFVWDDSDQIIRNTAIHDWSNALSWFRTNVWSFAGDTGGYYRPLFTASLALDYALWGERPAGFHLTNLILHALNCLGVWWLAKRLFAERWLALLATLIFAVHPVHVESVSWISGRTDLLAGFFIWPAIAIYTMVDANRAAGIPSAWLYAFSLVAFACSLLCKEVAILLPAGLWLYDVWIRKAGVFRSTLRALPFGLIVLGFLLLRQWAVGPTSLYRVDGITHLLTAPVLLLRYVGLLIFPHPQKLFYAIDPIQEPDLLSVATAVIMLGAVMAVVVWGARRQPVLTWTLVLFGLLIFPVSGFLYFTRPALMAERYLYLPSAAFCLAFSWGLGELWKQRGRRLAAALNLRSGWPAVLLSVSLLMALGIKTAVRNSLWSDDEHFVSRMAIDAPNHADSQNALGVLHFRSGRYRASIEAYEHALSLAPGNCDVMYNLGLAYMRVGTLELAEKRFEDARICRPGFSYAWFMRGKVSELQSKKDQALEHYKRAVLLNPTEPAFRHALNAIPVKPGKPQ